MELNNQTFHLKDVEMKHLDTFFFLHRLFLLFGDLHVIIIIATRNVTKTNY